MTKRIKSAPEDLSPAVDHSIEQPGVNVLYTKQAGGSGASSQPFSGSKMNASARIKAARELKAGPDEFFQLIDMLSGALGKPERTKGRYIFCVDEAGRDFDVVLRDEGRNIRVTVEKDGKVKYNGDADNAHTGYRAIQEAVRKYVKHEIGDAKAGAAILKKFRARPL